MEFRSLQSEEIDAWFDHVASVFTVGRQYFMNHWYNDPWQDLEGIRVAVDDGKIVSTVRVFVRQMYLHGEPVTCRWHWRGEYTPTIPSSGPCNPVATGCHSLYGSAGNRNFRTPRQPTNLQG